MPNNYMAVNFMVVHKNIDEEGFKVPEFRIFLS
jgi:hypothetical protein